MINCSCYCRGIRMLIEQGSKSYCEIFESKIGVSCQEQLMGCGLADNCGWKETCIDDVAVSPGDDGYKCVINGGWSAWIDKSSCSATCGTATKLQQRSCTNPEPAKGGAPCHGSKQRTVSCTVPKCPGMMQK